MMISTTSPSSCRGQHPSEIPDHQTRTKPNTMGYNPSLLTAKKTSKTKETFQASPSEAHEEGTVCEGLVKELRTAHGEAEKAPVKRGFSTVAGIQPHHCQKKPFMELNTTPRALNHQPMDLPEKVV
ncbi:hypothetical protein L484_002872 [Morus notabilis]|uniref:Uncharacterized protein n=1 Tax=Morus notabilis TaxID=981085 RepID=W9SAX7_9ROSA|nr:hypothetical protein L484_002872 [Morus notabilis]